MNLNDYEESMKMGEIEYKDNKYYFIPNKKEDNTEITGEELFTWFIYKGDKYPLTRNKYKIKEGDILKLGRVWLIVRAIHIPQKKLERKNTNCLISFHSQVNESLNINNDFKEDKQYQKLIEDNTSENEEENEEEEDESNKESNGKESPDKKKEKNNNNNELNKKKLRKYYKPKIIHITKKMEKTNFNSKKKDKIKLCRICYMTETNSILNPLIKPCKCSGSMKYIHLKCLLHWLKTKIQVDKSEYIENEYFSLYSSEKVECELCKHIFPHYIRHKKKLYNLLELETNDNDKSTKKKVNNVNYTDGDNIRKNKEKKDYANEDNNDTLNYVVFDTISVDKTIPSYIYIARFNKDKKLKIGRGLDMNLIMNDLSISRSHCELELCDNGDILLQDNNSKFGTLILVQAKSIEILKGQTLTIQVGRTYFNIYYKKENSFFSCCKAEVIDKRKTYEKMNYKAVKIIKNSIILNESETEGSDNEEGNKNLENDYDATIKKINNKKVNNLKLLNNKNDQDKTNINNKNDNNKIKDERKIEQKDNINDQNNKNDLFINVEQESETNKSDKNEEGNKNINNESKNEINN